MKSKKVKKLMLASVLGVVLFGSVSAFAGICSGNAGGDIVVDAPGMGRMGPVRFQNNGNKTVKVQASNGAVSEFVTVQPGQTSQTGFIQGYILNCNANY